MHTRPLLSSILSLALVVATAFADPPPPDWKFEGWLEGSANSSTARKSNLPSGFDLFANSAQLDQAWLGIEHPMIKPADGNPGRVGMRFDLYVGTDYFFTRARGLFGRQTSEIGFDPIQMYVIGHVDGIARGSDVQVGRFASPIGAEFNAGPPNLTASHSYSFIYDPFTHTGVFASTTLDDYWTLLNGVATGCDVFVDKADQITFLDGLRYVDKTDSKKSAQFFAITDHNRFDVRDGFNNIDVFDLVVTHPMGKRLLFTGDTIYGFERDVPGLGDVHWLGVVPYFTWTFNDTLASTLRLERFDDHQGNRTGFAGVYDTVTLCATWKATKALTLRPEVRYDHHDGAAPFEGRTHLATALIDVFVKW